MSKQAVVSLPFYESKTSDYCTILNKLRPYDFEGRTSSENEDVVTYEKFKAAFQNTPGWEGHFDSDSLLNRLLHDDWFIPKKEEHPEELSIDRLLLLGILLCNGKAMDRAIALWSVV